MWLAATQAAADTIRIATYAAPLSRDGPGLLLRDLGRDDDALSAIREIIAAVGPDVLLLTDFDHDHDRLALTLFADQTGYPHHFALRPNTGLATDMDLDLDGRRGSARDAQGYGRFPGDGGMAILSRYPILTEGVLDFSDVLWADLPGATLPQTPEGALWPDTLRAIQRLSTAGHWVVPIDTPGRDITLLAYAATPPVFDGPEDRNGLRNKDELGLWRHYLDGGFGDPATDFIVLGNTNLDPMDGQGIRPAMAAFLADPRLQDPQPRSEGGAGAANADQRGDPALDTADWPDDEPGNLRVSYVLPASTFRVTDAGVFWPPPEAGAAALLTDAGPHRLVWVDLAVAPETSAQSP